MLTVILSSLLLLILLLTVVIVLAKVKYDRPLLEIEPLSMKFEVIHLKLSSDQQALPVLVFQHVHCTNYCHSDELRHSLFHSYECIKLLYAYPTFLGWRSALGSIWIYISRSSLELREGMQCRKVNGYACWPLGFGTTRWRRRTTRKWCRLERRGPRRGVGGHGVSHRRRKQQFGK